MQKTILITGGLGYIWSHAVVEFEKAWYRTVIVDNLSNSYMITLKRISKILWYTPFFYEVDLRNRVGLSAVFKKFKFDGVLHFAVAKSPFESQENPLYYYNNNMSAGVNLFDLMDVYRVKNIVFSSSANVYAANNVSPVAESWELWPNNPYGRTKYLMEQILEDLHKFASFNVIHLRYFNPIGSHTSGLIWEHLDGIPNNIFPYIMKVAANKLDSFKVFGWDYDTIDGSWVRDYIDINDLVHGNLLAYDFLTKSRESVMDVFNLWTWSWLSVLELIKAVEKELHLKVKYEVTWRRAWDLAEVYCDTSKANKTLWFKTKVSVDQSIANTWKFYNNELYEK